MQELFELPLDEVKEINDSNLEKAAIDIASKDAFSNLEKIENALPQVKGLEASDGEIDELADLAQNSYKDLMDLGMQVESKFSAEIFNVAGTMLGHAITAKTAKINKKLKMIELQLKKAQIDAKTLEKEKELDNIPLGSGQSFDRNELLKAIVNKNTENDK